LSLWIVLLLSMVFIRRFMVPLEKLTEATRHLARRDFSHQIDIKSGDELETLALSFNMMSQQLHKQFSTLETISEISQDILTSLNSKQVIETALIRLSLFLQNDASQLILFKDGKSNLAMVHAYSVTGNVASEEMLIEIPAPEKREVLENRHLLRTGGEGLPPYLITLLGEAMPLILQLPLVKNGTLKGMINFGFKTQKTLGDQDCRAARQMADQITIALENAGLIETLEKMSWGTLKALARTVDAKSPWTAGHSERVTELALKIGGVMGLGEKEIISLHQAALVIMKDATARVIPLV
jgi:nitrate/nitrite-specific signal transduction histidine kinase